jgi:hypothetical protein
MINEEIKNILESEKPLQVKLLELQKIGRLVYEELNKPIFQSVYENSTEGLKSKIDAIKNDYIKVEYEINENEALLTEKDKIEKEFQDLKVKKEELAELKEKIRILNLPENRPSKINDEIAKFEGNKNDLIKVHIDALQNLSAVLSGAHNDLEMQLTAKINEVNKNLIAIEKNQINGLELLNTTPIKSKLNAFADEINRLVNEHNLYVEKIKSIKYDLEEIEVNHDMVTEAYKVHKLENETIFGALESREGVKNHVNLLRKQIDDLLLIYDDQIREIVKKRDQLPIFQLAETKKYQ